MKNQTILALTAEVMVESLKSAGGFRVRPAEGRGRKVMMFAGERDDLGVRPEPRDNTVYMESWLVGVWPLGEVSGDQMKGRRSWTEESRFS